MEIDTNQRTNLAFWLATVNPALFGGVILTGVTAAHSEIVLNFFLKVNYLLKITPLKIIPFWAKT